MRSILTIVLLASLPLLSLGVQAQENHTICMIEDRACLLDLLDHTAEKIEKRSWRDQTYRELAKTRTFEGDLAGALAIIPKIETPDTQAMTIRGIGMALATQELEKDAYNSAFIQLRAVAETIEHPPSYAIALTYIAMAQAFAGDNEGAWKTAGDMKNDALRHKAFAETAEIQAEAEDFEAAMISISKIESEAFRNKAYTIISKILANRGKLGEALASAVKISNAYKKSKALQYILDKQKPRDVERK